MSLKPVYLAIEKIASEPSTNAKQVLIKKYLDLPYFREVVHLAYNPFLKYKISSVDYISPGDACVEDIFGFLRVLASQRGANNKDRDHLNKLSSIDHETSVIVDRILKSDLRCGAGKKLFSKFIEIPSHDAMLCGKEWNKFMRLAGSMENVATSIKIDGVRVWAIVNGDHVQYLSRSGKEFPNFDVFDDFLIDRVKAMGADKNTAIFDGEVITKDKNFQKGLTQFRRQTGVTKDIFEFRIFDIVMDKPFNQRYGLLSKYFVMDYEPNRPHVNLVYHSSKFKTKEEIYKFLDQVTDNGDEGLVVKTWNGPYLFKRSDHWCKLKKVMTEDLRVIRTELGSGKYKNVLGALVCDYKGVEVNVGSGYDDKEREEFIVHPPKMIEVNFKCVTDDGSLREPIYTRVRDDKA